MSTMVAPQKPQSVRHHLFPALQFRTIPVQKPLPDQIPIESVKKYRDAAVWRLLCLEDRVEAADLIPYWELMDTMLDISVESAIKLLENLYEYRVRPLSSFEKLRFYPEIRNDLYRLEYEDGMGGYRDVCVGTLLNEAIDVLQAEAERLVRKG